MKLSKVAKRFLVPSIVVTAIYWRKYGCMISPRAEVELSPRLKIGRGTEISSFVKLKASDGDLSIGEQVSVGSGCFLSADAGGLHIGDFCMIGPNTSIIGNDYKYDRLDVPVIKQEKTSRGISIGNDVWVGAGCVITDGVTIGDHCIIAPNSLVKNSLPAGTIAMGNPAKKIFERR
jgi:acetyltransferase-like isoleucine patch superfamily enzyme